MKYSSFLGETRLHMVWRQTTLFAAEWIAKFFVNEILTPEVRSHGHWKTQQISRAFDSFVYQSESFAACDKNTTQL